MILKLFKYDFRAISGKLFPIYLACMIIAIINRIFLLFSINYLKTENQNDIIFIFLKSLQGFVIFSCFLAFFGVIIMTTYTMIIDYNNSIYGNEGYLLNTLPIERYKILISKILNFLVWSFFTMLLSGVFVLFLFPFEEFFIEIDTAELIKLIGENLKRVSDFTAKNPIVIFWTVSGTVVLILSRVLNILTFYLSVTIANLYKDSKVLIGIVAYFVIGTAISIVSSIFSIPVILFSMNRISNAKDPESFETASNFINTLLGYSFFLYMLLALILYFIILHLYKNKLNLE